MKPPCDDTNSVDVLGRASSREEEPAAQFRRLGRTGPNEMPLTVSGLQQPGDRASSRAWLIAWLGLFAFVALLASHNIADWDLWAKLALGANVWRYGTLPHHDLFAFTPVLPQYVDHEWGAGTIFFGLLKFFGPASLMCLKIALACGTLLLALATGRRAGCSWTSLFLLAIPAAGCVLFGYVPVIRSHAFTFFFFSLLLFCLEEIRAQAGQLPRSAELHSAVPQTSSLLPVSSFQRVPLSWPVWSILAVMLVWVNVHGGFVAGLGTIAIYTAFSIGSSVWFRESSNGVRPRGPSTTPLFITLALASLALSCVNPYGIKFWSYLLPAVMAKRPLIREWQPLPLLGSDMFVTFRLLFWLVVVFLIIGWKNVEKKSWAGLAMVALTAFLAWRSRRHVPFFGIASLAFAGPYLAATLGRLSRSAEFHSAVPPISNRHGPGAEYNSAVQQSGTLRYEGGRSLYLVTALYAVIALYAARVWLPQASLQVLAPIGDDPVREADILTYAQAKGNLATPFNWGSYAAWRLYPKIKISMDGRYEAAFPESTFQLNTDFFEKRGAAWDRLIREYPVDYVILDLSQGRLRPEDLVRHGYVLIWQTPGLSALLALEKHAPQLLKAASELPPTTIEPLDSKLTEKWWGAQVPTRGLTPFYVLKWSCVFHLINDD